MRSKNSKPISAAESEHMRLVKLTDCVTCDVGGPNLAHHVVQGDHYTTLSVCDPCHVGKHGIHGDQSMLRMRFKTGGERGELRALNETLRRVDELKGMK